MRIEHAIDSQHGKLVEVLNALDGRLTFAENMAPDGEVGQIPVSGGPDAPVTWQDLSDLTGDSEYVLPSTVAHVNRVQTWTEPQNFADGINEAAVTEHEAALAIDWSQLGSVPTTVAGYGITDNLAYTDVEEVFDPTVSGTTTGSFRLAAANSASADTQTLRKMRIGGTFNSGGYSTVLAYGLLLSHQYGTTGTQTFSTAVDLDIAAVAAGTVTLASWRGIKISAPSAATVSSGAGIYIGNIGSAAALRAIEIAAQGANTYALYTNAGLIRFGDDVDLASGKVYKVNNTRVVSARQTGWTDQTATASRADLGSSPTVGALASFCRAMYDDLKTHGLIGN